jgi:hypothetical protein
MTRPRPPLFPDPSAGPDDCAALIARWEAVLARAPRLRPWLEQMIHQRRTLLHEGARGSIEHALWLELARWVRQFESLPQFAVSAISTTLEDKERTARPAPEPDQAAPPDSPERAAGDNEALLADPAFALAFHCVETRLRPALPGSPPHWAWFGLLHASRDPQPLLTPEVAVSLVLRVLGGRWAGLPAPARTAALRLFHATAGDLRAASRMQKLCEALPKEWNVAPEPFVAGAARARSALEDACTLFARIAGAARPTQRGGLGVLAIDRTAPASPEELAAIAETARKFNQMSGLRRLLTLL